jgi:hypothetical protein
MLQKETETEIGKKETNILFKIGKAIKLDRMI